jgi:MFS family permease
LSDAKPVPVRDILHVPGFIALFLVSVISVIAQDLIVVYLPLLGAERLIAVDDIGTMLALRAIGSVVARLLFGRLHRRFGSQRLLIVSTFAGAAGYLALALPVPVAAMYVAIAVTGFALGIAITVAIAASMSLMTTETRGTATSLRMMGNRIAQFAIPFAVGVVAAVSGAAGIFGLLGLGLLASATAGHVRRNKGD